MKTRLKMSWLAVMVIALAGLLPAARAFYAPAAQRWINRDPIEGIQRVVAAKVDMAPSEIAYEVNLYTFGLNSPQIFADPDGLTATTFPIRIPWPSPKPISIIPGPWLLLCVTPDNPIKRETRCRVLHAKCVGSGLPCFDCLQYCRHYGSWPEDKCPVSKF